MERGDNYLLFGGSLGFLGMLVYVLMMFSGMLIGLVLVLILLIVLVFFVVLE